VVLITIGTNQGFAAGNNAGLRYALACGFPYVFLVNNDVVVERDALRKLVGGLEERPAWAGVAPKVLRRTDPARILYAGGKLRLWQARAVHRGRFAADGPKWGGIRTTEHLSACCALFRTDFLRDAGLLDDAFFFGQEDVALSCVAHERGWGLGVHLDARVVHDEGHSLASYPSASVYYFAKYRLLLLTKYGSRPQVVAGFVFLCVSRPVKFALEVLSGRNHLVKAEIRGYRDFFHGRLAEHDRAQARAAD
jgi:GT2 family glycosyltransferase